MFIQSLDYYFVLIFNFVHVSELEVQKSHDSLGDGETDVSKVLNSDSLVSFCNVS